MEVVLLIILAPAVFDIVSLRLILWFDPSHQDDAEELVGISVTPIVNIIIAIPLALLDILIIFYGLYFIARWIVFWKIKKP